jgi:hypothetical protein
MQGSKNLAVTFLLGAVLVGGALGFTADRVMIRDRLCATSSNSGSLRLTLADRLQLDATQRARLDSILDERHRRYELVMSTVRDQLDSVKMRARDQIRLVLTEEQRQEFEKLLVEMNDPNKSRDQD